MSADQKRGLRAASLGFIGALCVGLGLDLIMGRSINLIISLISAVALALILGLSETLREPSNND